MLCPGGLRPMTTPSLPSLARRASSSAAPAPSRPLHVAVVDEELPYPPTSGKRIRTRTLVLRRARRPRLPSLCHRNADPGGAGEAAASLRAHGIERGVVARAVPPRAGWRFYARLGLNLLS